MINRSISSLKNARVFAHSCFGSCREFFPNAAGTLLERTGTEAIPTGARSSGARNEEIDIRLAAN
jgi:hypothetical protein